VVIPDASTRRENASWAIAGNEFEGKLGSLSQLLFRRATVFTRVIGFRSKLIEIQRGRLRKESEPVTLPARRVRVLATRQADKFRPPEVKDVVPRRWETKWGKRVAE